jgi:cellulose synthase operon protein C
VKSIALTVKSIALIVVIVMGFFSSAVRADEPAQAFLDALRDNNYYDVAIDYLEGLKNSNSISKEFKDGLPFEMAQTLIGSTARMRDLASVESRLDQAQQLLTNYAANNQSLEVSAKTLHYQGNLLYRRSNIYLKQSESDRLTVAEREVLFGKARENLKGALTSYQKAKKQVRRLIDPQSDDSIQIDPEDPSTLRRRDQFQATYTQVRVSIPKVTEQLADTYLESDDEQKKLLTEARDEYEKVWEAYPKFIAGLKSCVYAARCSHKLGENKKALDLLSEVFILGDNSILKPIKLESFLLASDCWAASKKYPYKQVIEVLEPAVNSLNKVEVRQADWLRVQLEYSIAKHKKAEEVKAAGGPRATSDSNRIDRAAAKVLRNVARVASPYRDRAKQLLSEWNVNFSEVAEGDAKPPGSFDDARQKGKDFVTDLESAVGEASLARKQAAAAKGVEKVELDAKYKEAAEAALQQSGEALGMFDLALQLAEKSTLRADINNVRYLQCYCYFATQRYIESSLIGEFLLKKYPNVDGTRSAMTLLIQSYSIMLDRALENDKEFERSRLNTACDAVLRRWPGTTEAGVAASTMTRLALNDKDFDSARKYFSQIPKDAVYQPIMSVKLGQRLWFDYKAKARVAGADPKQLKPLMDEATQLMADGVNQTLFDELNYEVALGALLLVDARLKSGEVDKAIARLESKEIAPLDLLKQQHPVITGTETGEIYRREVYKTAIKAYLAAMKGADDQQQWIEKSRGVIDAMKADIKGSNDPKDAARVASIYQLIAIQLKEQFQLLDEPEKKQKFANSLSGFLSGIQSESNDAKTILWAGSTLLSVADSLAKSGLDDSSKEMAKAAQVALTRAQEMGFAGDPKESVMVAELKRQRALASRRSGNFESAMNEFLEILKGSPNSLNVQIDSADTLQMWAKVGKNQKRYIEAVKGRDSYKDPKTKRTQKRVWGWEKIALATRSNEKFRSTFYNALYHVVECRLEYGILAGNQSAIKAAGSEIAKEKKRDATFSGSELWKQKFSELEARVQQNIN